MCAAARVVAEIRDRARRRNPHFNPDGLFDTMHIRRGDFQQQYTSTQVNASVLYEISKGELNKNTSLYISTDETDKSFFKPFIQDYDTSFLDDFKPLFTDLNPNFMVCLIRLML